MNTNAAHRRKRPVTLLEMLVVMALIALIVGAVSFNVVKMRRSQQFRSAMTVVQQKLQAALETMLIHNETVQVVIQPVQKGLKIDIDTEIPLTKGLGRLLNRDPLVKGIDSYSWIPAEGRPTRGQSTLVFSPIAKAIPKGTLTFFGPGSLKRTIVLKGYPHPFRVTEEEQFEESTLDSETLYPKEVRNLWEAHEKS